MKPNVLHIVDSFEQGGTERQALQLVRLLKEHGRFGVRLACLNDRGPLKRDAERLGLGEIREYALTSFRDRNFLKQVRRLARRLREEEISVVHAHDFYTNVFGMAAALLARVPARIASKRETEFRTPAQKAVERCAFRLAHSIVVNAEAVRRQLVGEGVPGGKIVTLYNGLDLGRLETPANFRRDEVLSHFGIPFGKRIVAIVANVRHPVKDHPTFLRAARRVRERARDAAFVVAGEGELLETLRAYAAELGIEADVFFTGRCECVGELLAASDVCVLSSKAEGFSNSILEYMAASRPSVVTDVGGAREAIEDGETGFVVPAGDDRAMAERITQLLLEPESARRMGARARMVVEEKFSCGAQLERAEQLYEQLLSGTRRAATRGVVAARRESA